MSPSTPSPEDRRGRPTLFGSCPACHGEAFRAERIADARLDRARIDEPRIRRTQIDDERRHDLRADDVVAFRCMTCSAAWQYELGYVQRVA